MDQQIISGLKVMSRDELLTFSATAMETIERLERSNKQFKEDLEASGTVDVEVIWKWREWLGAMDKERDTWAQLATMLSAENKALKAENQKMIDRCEEILKMLDNISIYASVRVDGNKPPSFLIGVIHRIKKSIDASKSALLEFFADEPVEMPQPAAPVEPTIDG
jgi:hypothetical protein